MIEESYYLSEPGNLDLAVAGSGLAKDEIEELVGRFAPHSCRAGKLRGEYIIYTDGSLAIRHHFTKKILWSSER